ncbi:MAG TPA: ribosomal protein S18-alanine N-acetyltransferase [Actinomycetota bacterium]
MRAPSDPPQVPLAIEIVPMRRRHVREVLAIEREVYPRPWSAALFFSEIGQRKSRHYVVVQHDKDVIGYGGLMVHDDEGHITTIAVDPAYQHGGVGSRLMLNLVEEARARGARTIALEVRVANWAAQRLYALFGFRPVGIRKNYYAETGEDALVMWIEDCRTTEMDARLAKVRSTVGG